MIIKERKFYGLDGQEKLDDEIEEVIQKLFDDLYENIEDEKQTADKIQWPLKIIVYQREKIHEKIDKITEIAIDAVLDYLDERYGNPDDYNHVKATEAMKEDGKTFAKTIIAEYDVWTCEPTGEIIEVSREEALDMI